MVNNDRVNLLLPKNSKLNIDDSSKKVTALRIKKIEKTREFKVQLLNGKKKVNELYLKDMGIRIKSGANFMVLEILSKKKIVVDIHTNKILEDKEMKKYVNTLII